MFDAIMLRQVLLNVMANAIRHSPPKGRIALASTMQGPAWTITIVDEGPGVPADQLERIFGRFVRGQDADRDAPGGSGLGLSIARSIVEAHGGTIAAENASPRGLRVTVTLPTSGRDRT